MTTATKSCPRVKPVSGTCRWIRRLGDGDTKSGLLEINGTPYAIITLEFQGQTTGYRILKAGGTTYDVDTEWWTCTCPDSTYRQRECKHAKALRAALAAVSTK